MADERSNLESEEQKNGGGSDDDFGLPDFDFEALEDDEDDTFSPVSEPETIQTTQPAPPEEEEEIPVEDEVFNSIAEATSDEMNELSHEVDDLDIDLDDIDLDDADLADIDLENMDLDDIDRVLAERMSEREKETKESSEARTASESPISTVDDVPGALDTAPIPAEEDVVTSNESEASDMPSGIADSGSSSTDIVENGDLFYEEETYDEFESSAGFGTPTQESAGGKTFVQQTEVDMLDAMSPAEATKARFRFIKIVAVGTVMFLGIAFGFNYLYREYGGGEVAQADESENPQASTTEAVEETSDTPPPVKSEDTPSSDVEDVTSANEVAALPGIKEENSEPARVEKSEPQKKVTPNRPDRNNQGSAAAGVERLPSRTNKYYLIVGSFINDTRAFKYAQKLQRSGASAFIIPPFNGASNHRVAVADYSTLADAKRDIPRYQGMYPGVWPLKY